MESKIKEDELKIKRIKNGIVIDHIRAGQALNVCKILNISPGTQKVISIAMNVESKKMGRKDILKIEERKLEIPEIHKIAIISPEATINVIENFEVKQKENVKLPEMISGIIKCQNPNCISNDPQEPVVSKFIRKGAPNNFFLQCYYCGHIIEEEKLIESII